MITPERRREARQPLHVLIVDDSAVVRQTLLAILGRSRDFIATSAPDAVVALSKIRRQRPDVILLDLDMPRMDGMSFLEKLMAEDPIPVVICSGFAPSGSRIALRALEAGAVEVVSKPKIGVREFLTESAVMLMDALNAAAQAKIHRRGAQPIERPAAMVSGPAPERAGRDRVVVIGASTGGTDALRVILEAMPSESPGLVVVQHMPEQFTAAFAARLNEICRIEVKEAADGDRVTAGRALIAPGNHHLLLTRGGAPYVVRVQDGPLVSRHRPSVDMLFQSAAQVAGADAVGVILTGMGDDGARGLSEMKAAGAATLAQDEESCVVFGMPREAIAIGAADEVLPLSQMAGAVLRRARSPRGV